MPGNEKNPWKVGTEDHEADVIAWTNGTGTLIVEGAGAVGGAPWTESADGIAELLKDKDVTGLEGIMATLPALTTVNGLTLDELASANRRSGCRSRRMWSKFPHRASRAFSSWPRRGNRRRL